MPSNPENSTSRFRDTAIQDMLGRPPGWLLRSGLGSLAVVVTVALLISAFVNYPERVEAPFVLQSETVPLALHAGAMTYVDAMLVADRTAVTAGDTLMVFRSEGNWRNLGALAEWISQVAGNDDATAREEWPPSPPLRDYPAAISQLVAKVNSIFAARRNYLRTNGVAERIAALQEEISKTAKLSASLNLQVELYDQELEYQHKGIERTRYLKAEGLLSVQEAEELEARAIAAARQREILVTGEVQNELTVSQLRQRILELKLGHRSQLAAFRRQLWEELPLLQMSLTEFSNLYLLIAPEAGIINWQPDVREKATVSPARPVGFIVPEFGDARKVARLELPADAQGRAAIGNEVLLEFAAYPAREFGQLRGEVAFIDPIALPDDERQFGRRAVVHLPYTLITSYDLELPFQYNLTGTARIITRERTILQRVFDQFLNLSKNR